MLAGLRWALVVFALSVLGQLACSGSGGDTGTGEFSMDSGQGSATASASGGSQASDGSQCSGDLELGGVRPRILEPTQGQKRIGLKQLQLRSAELESSAVPDAALHVGSEWQVWTQADSVGGSLIWSSRAMSSQALLTAALEDGQFVGPHQALAPRSPYLARVRFEYELGAACGHWTDWSTWRAFETDDGSEILFDQNTLLSIHLDIPPESMDAIDEQAVPPDCIPYARDYYRGDLRVEGDVGAWEFLDVGVRSKGGCGSARGVDGKMAFKIKLDWDDPELAGCGPSRRLLGQKTLTLNNMTQDDSFLHERLGYWLYHQLDVPSPRATHARVYVNGEYWGLYLLIESMKRRFLDRWFSSNDGMLYEGVYHCDLLAESFDEAHDDWLEDESCFQRKFKLDECDDDPPEGADPQTFAPIRDLVDTLEAGMRDEEYHPAIGEFIDWPRFVSMWAADTVIGHWDGYGNDYVNNYRIYHNPDDDLWTMIPSGIDQSFEDPLDPYWGNGRLVYRCYRDSSCEPVFEARVLEALEVFESRDWSAEIDRIVEQIADSVEDDPRKEVSTEDWYDQVEEVRDYPEWAPDYLRDWLDAPFSGRR